MKYVPKEMGEAAEASSGGGTRGMLRETVRLSIWGLIALVGLYLLIGVGTDLALRALSFEQEQEVFAALERGAFETSVPADLAEEWALAEAVFAKLRTGPAVPPYAFKLRYTPMVEPNAFAVPGGTILLTRGLLEALVPAPDASAAGVSDQAEAEIAFAFVIGHELGHFAHRDHLRGLGRRVGLRLSLLLVFGGKLDGLTERSSNLLDLGYSRHQESAADVFALELLDAVYGRREGAGRLFEHLLESEHLPRWAYMFSTHPDALERLGRIRKGAKNDSE